jgi:LysR family transcriptional regulator of gallate degradation
MKKIDKIASNSIIFDTNGIPHISLRQLKAVIYIKQCSNMTKAAVELNRSQTAITKALITLEKSLNNQLFDRFSTGMKATVYGEALYKRILLARNQFEKAGQIYEAYFSNTRKYQNIPIFSMEISYKRLSAFITLYQTLNMKSASELLGITKTALYGSIRKMEEWLQIKLFDTGPNDLTPTSYCVILAKHVKLAFTEIRHALEDLANIDGITEGSVKVGSLPYTRTFLIPKALNSLLIDYPNLDVATQEGPYAMMEASLRSGEIDFIIGAVRLSENSNDITTEVLFEDKLSIIARKGHPLTNKKQISFSELANQKWVLPSSQTPAWKILEETMKGHNVLMPQHAIQTSSLSIVRGLLIDSDRVSLLSEHQIYYDIKCQLLEILSVEMTDTYRPIGITMRKNTQPSPVAKLFLDKIRKVAKNFKRPTNI